MIGEIIGLIVVGLIVGALGRLFHPGRDPIGLLATIVIGVASMLIVGLLIESTLWSFIFGVIVAIVLVALYARMVGPRRTTAVGRV
jgi:uncharacterized membrane protein YeaQ/YmgE (transglycosylase-associated protein family)